MPLPFPLSLAQTQALTATHPTPFHLYSESVIRQTAQSITSAFKILPAYREFFAVKALPNPFILKILASEGFGADCSSLAELELCRLAGLSGDRVMFTSNETPDEEFRAAFDLGAILNLDDISHVEALRSALGGRFPSTICFRYNPGPARTGNAIIGNPSEAKYGLTRPQILEAYPLARSLGATRFGLHTMVVSNELNPDYHVETARMVFALALEIFEKTGIRVSFVNNGGGLGIPYKPGVAPMDLSVLARGIAAAYDELIRPTPLHPLAFFTEWGRFVTGPAGWLVTRAIRHKSTYREYVGVDASMADLMRPGIYGAYHHIAVLGKGNEPATKVYDVVGSLCENCDKFAVQRPLPPISDGDLLVIHDTGAHGHAMGYNYNGKLRHAELLLRPDGTILPIRRSETLSDLFSTLPLSSLPSFS